MTVTPRFPRAARASLCLLAAAAVVLAAAIVPEAVTRNKAGQITALSFRSTWIGDEDLGEIAANQALTSLDLSHTRITDIGFQKLKNLPAVEDLNLYYAEQIGDGTLVILKGWKKLKHLNLRGTKVTDLGVAQLAGHPSLESLDVGYSLFTDNGFDPMTQIPNLKRIAAGGNKLTDVGLNLLRLLPALEALDLAGAQRTDSGLWAAIITDKGLETIGQLKNLRELNLRAAKISDAGMGRMSSLAQLEDLNLAQTNLSAAGLQPLAGLPKIAKLTLYKCQRINDDAVDVLARMKSLRWLDVEGTQLTPAGLEKLQAALPGCRIQR
jgi:Leucine-rich repeat (LRR) protein